MEVNINKQELDDLFNSTGIFQVMIDSFDLPVFYKDTNGIYRGCNDAFATFLGRPKNEIINKKVTGVALPKKAEMYKKKDSELFLGKDETQTYRYSVDTAEGEKEVMFYKARFRGSDVDNKIVGLIGIIVDFTEISKNERDLKRYHDLVELSEQGIIIHKDFIVKESNNRFAEILGHSYDDIITSNVARFFTTDSFKTLQENINNLSPILGEAKKKDGSTSKVEIRDYEIVYNNEKANILWLNQKFNPNSQQGSTSSPGTKKGGIKLFMSLILATFILAITSLWVICLLFYLEIPVFGNYHLEINIRDLCIVFGLGSAMLCFILWLSHHINVIQLSSITRNRIWRTLIAGILGAVGAAIAGNFK